MPLFWQRERFLSFFFQDSDESVEQTEEKGDEEKSEDDENAQEDGEKSEKDDEDSPDEETVPEGTNEASNAAGSETAPGQESDTPASPRGVSDDSE